MEAEKLRLELTRLGGKGTRHMLKICSGGSRSLSFQNSMAHFYLSIFHGTAMDTSLLIDHLESYIFHGPDHRSIDQHLVMGISLGGHAAWQVLFNDERVTAAVVIIGCPDYMRESYCFMISLYLFRCHIA